MMEPAEVAKALKPVGIPGAVSCVGILGGTTSSDWPSPYPPWVASLGFGAFGLGLVWFLLIFVHRLSGWSLLSSLDR